MQARTTFEKITELGPLVLIAIGIALDWLRVPLGDLMVILGFLLYGVFGAIFSIRRKYYQGVSIRFFKLVNDIAIVLLTISFFYGQSPMMYLLLLILLDRLILLPRVVERLKGERLKGEMVEWMKGKDR